MDIKECLREGYLKRIKPDKSLVEKELKESGKDLESARKARAEGNYKWSVVMAYYSMFHAARALLFSEGYREKRHFAVQVFLEDRVKRGLLESTYAHMFSSAMEARENADYRYSYSEAVTEDILEYAARFIQRMKKLL